MTTHYLDLLRSQFNNRVRFTEKRPRILQLEAPLFHEDGDMMDIFIQVPKNGSSVRICDFGMTLMRLSYNLDIATPGRERVLQRILAENYMSETDGNLWMETKPEGLYPAIMQFAQVVGKISNMQLYKREVVHSLFMEMLGDYVQENLANYRPEQGVHPIPDREYLEADWQFTLRTGKPVYMFGVRDKAKSRLAMVTCLEFQKAELIFTSMVVHENFATLSQKDRSLLTSSVDKQFISLDDFQEHVKSYLQRAS